MFIRTSTKTGRAWTLVEMMMAVGIFSLTGLALMSLYLFCVKGMASMYNYSLLDQYNRQAMNLLTREIRQAIQVVSYTTNSITIQTGNTNGTAGPRVTYSFNGASQRLLRTSTDGTSQVLLNNCSLLSFSLYTRIPVGGSYGAYPVATNNWQQTVKVLQLTWKTAITNSPSNLANSENIQTALVVIRKQQDS
jgi:type II secretory pathway pseudopilin PulG